MSIEAVAAALLLPIEERLKMTLVVVADCHNARTGRCFPSQQFIAEMLGRDVRTVQRRLDALEADGLIERVHRQRENGSRTSDEYRLIFAESNTTPVSGRAESNTTRVTVQHDIAVSPPEPEGESETASPNGESVVRDDIGRLCALMAEAVRSNGYTVPSGPWPVKTWLDPFRLLLDRDVDPATGQPWTVEQVEYVIRWATSDEFWKQNVRGPAALRKKDAQGTLRMELLVGRIRQEKTGIGTGVSGSLDMLAKMKADLAEEAA